MKKFLHITIGELLEIKKISKMTIKEAVPKMIALRDKHNFTDMEVKNLVCLARDFNTTLVLKKAG